MSKVVLSLRQVDARYGNIQALHGVSLEVRQGQIVALLGRNGAGKSTTLRTISGVLTASSGTIEFLGQDIARIPAHRLPHLGLIHVPEGRRIFGSMTIKENLDLGSFVLADEADRKRRAEQVFEIFPVLARRRNSNAVYLSGGEQQMLAIGRALMAKPKLLLLDEPSMGLAPLMVKEVMRVVQQLNETGLTVLLVEQNSKIALKAAHYGYVIESGQITLKASAEALRNDNAVVKAYLGGDGT